MSIHLGFLGFLAAGSRHHHHHHHHHHCDHFLLHPAVTPLEERRLLSAVGLQSSLAMSPAIVASNPAPSISAGAASSGQNVQNPSVHAASPLVSPAAPVAIDPVAVDNAIATFNGGSTNGGSQMALLSAAGNDPGGVAVVSAGNPSSSNTSSGSTGASSGDISAGVTGSSQSTTLTAQLSAVQSTFVVGAAPSATGLSAPVPAVVAVFAAQQPPISAIAPTAQGATALIANAPVKHIMLTGGDIPQPATAPPAPMSPALPQLNPNLLDSDLLNDARDQVLQEFGRPKPPPPANEKAIEKPLHDTIDPSLPLLSPDVNRPDDSLLLPADPGILLALQDNISPAALGLAVELRPAQAESDSARWVSLAVAAAATIDGAKADRKLANRPHGATRVLRRIEPLTRFR